jgi:hypothetical protein
LATKIEQHGTPDVKPASPIYRHSTESARSQNDAGGEVPAGKYMGKTPGLTPKKV